jgi:ubiquinone/menaquinone biosynthesis C-methylase UbiE
MATDDGSISFDRIADRYEETRGGLERGRRFAATIDGHLKVGSLILELGVGTAAVARPLADLGHRVVGVDLAPSMLAVASERLPGRLVLGDATRLPVRGRAVDAVVAVWAVHVVGDVDALIAETARVLVPVGRLLVVAASPDIESNDLTDVAYRLGPALGRGGDRSERLAPRLAAAGFAFLGDELTDEYAFEESPEERAAMIEGRDWSSLWGLDDETWARVVQPVIDDLRALPDPGRPRHCVHRHLLSVYRAS